MYMEAAEILLAIAATYAGAGLLFGLAFVFAGVGRIDPVAAGSGIGFRLLILPGAAALWPLLLVKWVRGRKAT
jgi:hypothetical protein